MSALARTPTGDIAIPLAIVTDPATLARNKVIDQFNLWQGEWFADQLQGFPWVQRVFAGKRLSMTQLRSLLHRSILQAPGVISVTDLVLTKNAAGAVNYVFEAMLNTGDVVVGGAGAPYLVPGNA